MAKKMHVCDSCGIKRDDCKRDIEGLLICATCATGAMPKSEACREKMHQACKTEACYCSCHPDNDPNGQDTDDPIMGGMDHYGSLG